MEIPRNQLHRGPSTQWSLSLPLFIFSSLFLFFFLVKGRPLSHGGPVVLHRWIQARPTAHFDIRHSASDMQIRDAFG